MGRGVVLRETNTQFIFTNCLRNSEVWRSGLVFHRAINRLNVFPTEAISRFERTLPLPIEGPKSAVLSFKVPCAAWLKPIHGAFGLGGSLGLGGR